MKTVGRMVTAALALAAVETFAAKDPAATLKAFRAPARECREAKSGYVWLEAEAFADYGGWEIDTQYVQWMGSAYLITKGVLKPLAPARTEVEVKTAGRWNAWVRTLDWLPEFSPGKFAISIDGRRSEVLGASKQKGWRWQKAGAFDLKPGKHSVELVDLAGGFARCDAILLTVRTDYVPPDGGEELATARIALAGRDAAIADGGAYDVVVVGGGPAGLGASIAAARNGARTVMIHDRPVLGGNASIEQHTNIGGASSYNRSEGAADTREGGIVDESRLMRRGLGISNSEAFQRMVEGEKLLVERANERVIAAEAKDGRVVSVTAYDTLTGKRTRYRGKVFVDGTGDGWVGRFVGADLMYGREAKAEFGEPDAPEVRDTLTMSGCIDDYLYHDTGREVPFERPAWAKILPDGFNRPDISGIGARWWLEHPGTFDDLREPERARDELIRIHIDYWNFLRSHPKFGEKARRCTLDEIKIHNGRREGWRMRGDYVLTSVDCRKGTIFPDAVTYGGWALDIHDPKGVMNPKGNGWWSVDHCKIYTIPYRCIYSRNISNLLMGGRNVSVTHAALGSTRIMATIFTLGQAAGTAAAMMVEKGVSAREIGRDNARELRQRLLKDDQFIPGAKNEDPADLARGAKVTASSCIGEIAYGKDDPEFIGVTWNWAWKESLWLDVAACFPRNNIDRLEEVVCYLRNTSGAERELIADIYESDEIAAPDSTRRHLATARAKLPAGGDPRFQAFRLDKPVALAKKYVWVKIRKCGGVNWFSRLHVFPEGGCMAYAKKPGELEIKTYHQMAVYTTPARRGRVDARPEYVIDGQSRPDLWPSLGTCTHAWRADPKAALPQWIRLDLPEPKQAAEVRIVFDPIMIIDGVPGFQALVKDYDVLGLVGGKWKTLASVKDNFRRLAIHRFPQEKLSAVKVRVNATRGLEARIQEIRIYGGSDAKDGSDALAPADNAVFGDAAVAPDGKDSGIPTAPAKYRRPKGWKPTRPYPKTLREIARDHSQETMERAKAQMAKVNAVNREGKYKATGAGMDRHQCPEWFVDAKLGMFVDWGLYSVAAYSAYVKGARLYPDWYEYKSREDYGARDRTWDYHCKNWGADFKPDHFIGLFKGVDFDAPKMMKVFRESGAKYVVPFLKHHSGFCEWDCSYTFRDTVDSPAKRDFTREMVDAARAEGLKFGVYNSQADEWEYPILQDDGSIKIKLWRGRMVECTPDMEYKASGKVAVRDFVYDYIVPQMTEFVDKYDPDILWYDADWSTRATENGSYDISAYFYNKAEGRKEVCCNDRFGRLDPAEEAAFERKGIKLIGCRTIRGDFFTDEWGDTAENIDPKKWHPWESCSGISKAYGNHWMEEYDPGMVMTDREFICHFTSIVARGGNLLLLVNLDGQGAIPKVQEERLRSIGRWLGKNGEAIYATRICAPYSTESVDYTRSKDGKTVYAIVKKPTAVVNLACEAKDGVTVSCVADGKRLESERAGKGVRVRLPDYLARSPLPVALRLN